MSDYKTCPNCLDLQPTDEFYLCDSCNEYHCKNCPNCIEGDNQS